MLPMQSDIRLDIKNLESEIMHIEEDIVELLQLHNDQKIKKHLQELRSDLKHLSIIANGAPLEKSEDRKVMDFLRVHYNNLQKLSVPA